MTSRARFKSRTSDNIAILVTAFVIVVFLASGVTAIIFSSFLPMFGVDAIAIGAVYYFYILWNKRAIRLRCRSCKKIVVSNTPWVCTVCGKSNLNTAEFPFVHECQHCGSEPKAYRCHNQQCRELIFLSEDEDQTNYAHRFNSPDDIPKPDGRANKRQAHQETKEDKENEIAIAELDEKLRKIKEQAKEPKIKTPGDRKQETCEQDYIGIMGVREYCRRKTIEVKELYKGDPEGLRDALEAIEAIRIKYA